MGNCCPKTFKRPNFLWFVMRDKLSIQPVTVSPPPPLIPNETLVKPTVEIPSDPPTPREITIKEESETEETRPDTPHPMTGSVVMTENDGFVHIN